MNFSELALHDSILKAIEESGYTTPTPIQSAAIPQALAGQDLLAAAQTGTGKTAAFVLPCLQRLTTPAAAGPSRGPRVLVLTPTRELAQQVTDACMKYGKHLRFRIGSLVGGMPYGPQLRLLSQPVDILIATPGRLLDHMERGRIDYSRLEVLVLDEADRMLDMGFIHAVEEIAAATPATRQTLLFSATFSSSVTKLAQRHLRNPQRIEIASAQQRHDLIEQRLHHVDDSAHKHKVLSHLLNDKAVDRVIVFTATKHGADRLAQQLEDHGHPAAALHGNMNQSQRTRAISRLRSGAVRLLVATDVAARGLDVPGISHVINYDLPRNPEDYVHRIGRTGRAGAKGIAISFAGPDERRQLRDIERYTNQPIEAHVIEGLEPKFAGRAGGSDRSGPRPPQRRFGSGPRSGAPRSEGGYRSSGGGHRSSEGGGYRGGDAPRSADGPRSSGGYRSSEGHRSSEGPRATGGYRSSEGSRASTGGYHRPADGSRPTSGGGYRSADGHRSSSGGGYRSAEGDRQSAGNRSAGAEGGYRPPQRRDGFAPPRRPAEGARSSAPRSAAEPRDAGDASPRRPTIRIKQA